MAVRLVIMVLLEVLGASAAAAEQIRLDIARDTWLSAVDREANANLGGASQLKLKSIQEMSLVDIDPTPLRGKVVRGATLHVRQRGNEQLGRVTVSSVATDWVEGTSARYEPQNGSSCFNWAKYPSDPWAWRGSDLTAVTVGQGGTVWSSIDASEPDAQGWISIPVAKEVLAARVAGVSKGFLLFDDTGSEWKRDGEKFTLRLFPNRFVYSREGGKQNAPFLTVDVEGEDHDPPGTLQELKASTESLPAGEALVSWLCPADAGTAGVAGFLVRIDGKIVPQYLVPKASPPGEFVAMRLRDLGLSAGQRVEVSIRAVDGAGNVGQPGTINVEVSKRLVEPLAGEEPTVDTEVGKLPEIAGAQVAVIDALDKYVGETGKMIPPQVENYLAANHLWNAKKNAIRLHAARNEFISFQILLNAALKEPVRASVEFPAGNGIKTSLFRFVPIPTKSGMVGDPLVPFDGIITASDDKSRSALCEIYVPHEITSGAHLGKLVLSTDKQRLEIPIELSVWSFALPDRLSFIPELNCYGLPDNEGDYYRLAHRNRTVINRVPYHQDGSIARGCAPRWDGKKLDWTEWDKRFGPYFDGSKFNDLPRKGVPLDIFYLPLHENWPTPIDPNYNGSYWADKAFPASYRAAFVECSRQIAEHFNQKHWDQTNFLCFFNGKNNFKSNGWSHGSCPWILDEPTNFQDFWALRWFGQAFHEGVAMAPGGPKMLFRCDISRPQWQRDVLDGVLNYNVVAGGPFHQYNRVVMERKERFNQIAIPYGSSNDPANSNVQPAAWCWDSWTLGGDGVLPWQVIGSGGSWKKGEDTCLFYPGSVVGLKEPVASVRLKAYLRGEQDVEYLVLLAAKRKRPRWELGQQVRTLLALKGERKGTGFTAGEDAGIIDFGNLKPQDLWRARERIAAAIEQ